MSYYKLLGLNREPFSTSPEPEFFYQSRTHKAVLYRLRIAIELKRGVSLVLGDVGTGKTTLSRILAQLLRQETNVIMTMLLNPIYTTEDQFLEEIAERFHIPIYAETDKGKKIIYYMKEIERFLFEKGVEQNHTIVILIDEAQKLNTECLELLRTLLNYETNEYKILQLILMGQMELLPKISCMRNLWDRMALKCMLTPLGEEEIKELINYRLSKAGYSRGYPLFTDEAIKFIYKYTHGYPRRIGIFCHDALEYLVMHEKTIVDRAVCEAIAAGDIQPADTINNKDDFIYINSWLSQRINNGTSAGTKFNFSRGKII